MTFQTIHLFAVDSKGIFLPHSTVMFFTLWRDVDCLNFEIHDKKEVSCCHELMCCAFACCTFQILGSTEKARKVPDVNP